MEKEGQLTGEEVKEEESEREHKQGHCRGTCVFLHVDNGYTSISIL